MDPLLKLLQSRAKESAADLAAQLGVPEADVSARIAEFERSGIIRGYRTVLNTDALDPDTVTAIIGVKVTPEHEGGFNHIAMRISRFPEVVSSHLVSGQADLLLFVEGRDLRQVAAFVSERLSAIPGVTATSTSFLLKTYKQHGFMMETQDEHERLKISP